MWGGEGGVYGCMDVGEDDRGTAACCSGSIKADSLSPLTTPAATASPFQFHRRLSSLHSQPVLLIKSILIQCLYFDISEAYRQLILLQGGSLCVCVSQLLSSVFKSFHKSLFCNKKKQLR